MIPRIHLRRGAVPAAALIFAVALVALVATIGGTAGVAAAAEPTIGDMPVQHEGRIKPVDTLARVHLLASYGKRSLRDLEAIDWFLELSTEPEAAMKRAVFKLRSPEVASALDLPERDKLKYTHEEVVDGLLARMDQLQELHRRAPEERDYVENQLVELYMTAIRYRDLSATLSCLTPEFYVDDPALAAELLMAPGRHVSFFHFIRERESFRGVLERLEEIPRDDWSASESALMDLSSALSHRRRDEFATGLRIVPPEPGSESEAWAAPWELMDGRDLGPMQLKVLLGWEAMLAAHVAGNEPAMAAQAREMMATVGTGENGLPKASVLTLETWNSRTDPFYKSVALYILSFLLLAISWMGRGKLLRRLALVSLGGGLFVHLAGLGIRMIVMGRPPVSTLYESVVFVGCVAALTGFIVELVRRDGMGTFIGATIGAVLHFVGFGYAADGDTLGMLVAVLNSNFWLATHVVTITIGYGCAIVSGLAGHVYLVWRVFRPGRQQQLDEMSRNMTGLTLVALFFTLFGTILGGIWADQSWGRFWGWDPKENGALLIVMWQLLLLHGKVSGHFQSAGFAVGLVLNNIVVALAWFGVNLLNVGLHTYGFTANIAINLAIFAAIEIVFVLVMYPLARVRGGGTPTAV